MNIKVNGENKAVCDGVTIAGLVEGMRANPQHTVVEYNGKIVACEEWERTVLGISDQVEILSFVGGG